ncbi:hypothetical protein KY362_00935 [Candidatus Woesearchaeota archaeon]|nr:hypothetical protein [Candidatus Woesearchaeota archaeon]
MTDDFRTEYLVPLYGLYRIFQDYRQHTPERKSVLTLDADNAKDTLLVPAMLTYNMVTLTVCTELILSGIEMLVQ